MEIDTSETAAAPNLQLTTLDYLELPMPVNRASPTPVSARQPPPQAFEGMRRVVLDPAELPPAPAGLKWQLEYELESLPVQYQFKLVADASADGDAGRPSVREFRDAFVGAFDDGFVTDREGQEMARTAGDDLQRLVYLYRALIARGPSMSAGGAGAIRRHLILHGANDNASALRAAMAPYL